MPKKIVKNEQSEEVIKKTAEDAKSPQVATKNSDQPSFITPNTVLTMEIDWATIEPAFNATKKSMAKRIKMDGFRKGKVPPQLAQQYVGEEQIVEKTVEAVLPKLYPDFIRQSGKIVLGKPEFQVIEADVGKTWKVLVNIAEKPVLDLKNVQKELKQIKKDRAADAAKRAAEKAAKEKEQQKTETTDAEIAKRKQEREVAAEREALLGFTYAKLGALIKPQIPELLVKQEAEEQLHSLGHQLSRFNLTYADFLKQRNLTEEQFMQEVTMSSLTRLQLAFVVDALITEFELKADEEAVTAALIKESEEAQKYYLENPDARMHYANRLAQTKLEDFLLAD